MRHLPLPIIRITVIVVILGLETQLAQRWNFALRNVTENLSNENQILVQMMPVPCKTCHLRHRQTWNLALEWATDAMSEWRNRPTHCHQFADRGKQIIRLEGKNCAMS